MGGFFMLLIRRASTETEAMSQATLPVRSGR